MMLGIVSGVSAAITVGSGVGSGAIVGSGTGVGSGTSCTMTPSDASPNTIIWCGTWAIRIGTDIRMARMAPNISR